MASISPLRIRDGISSMGERKATTISSSTFASPLPKTPGGGEKGSQQQNVSYEVFAPRSAHQRSRLAQIQSLTLGPTIPKASNKISSSSSSTNVRETSYPMFLEAMFPTDKVSNDDGASTSAVSPAQTSMSMTVAENSLMRKNETIQKTLQEAHRTSSHIGKTLMKTSSLHSTLVQTTTLAQAITDRHEALLQHSSELSHAAERLQTESDQLTCHAEEIGLPLKHYDAVDRLGLQVGILFKNNVVVKGLARVKVDDDQFIEVLNDIDSAVIFFAERSQLTTSQMKEYGSEEEQNPESAASGSIEYYKRALALQEAAMDLFKEAIVTRILQTSSHVNAALDLKRKHVNGDTLEASLIYTRFHGISSRSHQLLNIVQSRMGTVTVPRRRGDDVCPYTELWAVCRNTYIQSRQLLLNLSVRNHLDFLREKHGLIGMTRLASVFLMRLCTAETSMYLDFFGKDETPKEELEDESEEGTNVRASDDDSTTTTQENGTTPGKPKKDAATLASQVMDKDGTYYDFEFQTFLDALCNNLHRTIRRGLVSILELDTLCQVVSVLREERSLANASPTTMAAARSLGRVIVDAQERLIFCANATLSKEVVRFKSTPSDLDYPDKLRRCREQQDEKKEEDALKAQMQIYESWFPPIRSILKVLSKIFRVVEPNVFEDIALSSVQACARSLKDGSAYIGKKSGQLHSDLFLVKHLLILREQLSPFDIQLRSVERQLDFSRAGKAVSRFLANRNRRLFSMSTENALITLLREGVNTQEATIDSKRDLEDALRSACNDFIEHTSEGLAGQVITFVEQCKSITATEGNLSSQSFMTGEYLMAVVSRTQDRLEPELGEVTTQMSLYMDNPATQSILLKPVVRKILRILEDSKRFINECATEENDAWADDEKDKVLKIIDEIGLTIKSASPRT